MILNRLPVEVIYHHIFPYLNPIDIFSLGQCSKATRVIVIELAQHPLSTTLQAIKTTQNYLHNIRTAYDTVNGESLFSGWEKCSKDENCSCTRYRQRRTFTMMDPAYCKRCVHDFEDISYLLHCRSCSVLL